MGKTSRTKNSAINLVTGLGGQALTTILSFVNRTIFIYTLGGSYLGISSLFTNVLSVLSLAELGIGSAIVYRLYKPLAEKDDKRVRILIKFYKLAYRIIGFFIFGAGLLLIPFLPMLIKDYDRLEVLGINAVLVFVLYLLQSASSYLFFAYRSTVLNANQKRYILDLVRYIVNIVTTVVHFFVLYFFRSFVLYIATSILFSIISNIIIALIATKQYPQFFERESESLSKQEMSLLLKDCGALFLFKANGVVVKACDNLVLGKIIGIVMVGKYSNYLMFYRMSDQLVGKVFTSMKASLGNLFAVESMEVKYRFFKIVNLLTGVLYGTMGLTIAVCGNELIQAWIGLDYVIEQPLPLLVGIELFTAGMVTNLNQFRSVTGIFRQMWYRPLIGIAVNLVVSVGMAYVCGVHGVIIGTIVTHLSSYIALEPRLIYKYAFENYRPVWDYYKKNLQYFVIQAAVFLVDLFVCRHCFAGHGWLSVIVHVVICGLSVPCVMLAVYWKTEECRYLVATTLRITKKVLRRLNTVKR